MPDSKAWLKGVVDGKPTNQQLLVTGSARKDTFRQSGEPLAGRFFGLRLHPISVREWCEQTGAEVDFAPSLQGQFTHLVECKLSDPKPHRALQRFAREQPQA